MAIYKGREVTILNEVKQPQTNPVHIMIRYQDGQNDYVPLQELQLTSDEKKTLEKASMARYDTVKVISDKDVQNIRDSQDSAKIEKATK